MDPVRKGEIALKLVEVLLAKKAEYVVSDMAKKLEEVAKASDIPLDELKTFAKEGIHEAVDKFFAQQEVGSKPTG